MSLEGLGVSERQSRRGFRSTNGLQIGNRRKDGNRMGKKRKEISLPSYCVLVG